MVPGLVDSILLLYSRAHFAGVQGFFTHGDVYICTQKCDKFSWDSLGEMLRLHT